MLGPELRKAREAAGLTQEELGARARVSREYVSRIERGVYSPTVSMFLRICNAMETPAWVVLRRIERCMRGRAGQR